MRHPQWLIKLARRLHRWVGLYVIGLTLIWVIEAIAVPRVFSAGLPIIDELPPEPTAANTSTVLSREQATRILMAHSPAVANQIDEIAYLPLIQVYRFENHQRFFEWFMDAHTGKVLKYGFNAGNFLQQKGFLGWLHPWVGNLIKLPSALLTLILVISGFYLFVSSFRVN
ncbi:PepSY domain-containing protein [Myxacorys almedinensis]|uniref:PepSY domain-containing protein n=1 Tax=Myxacorys almedinensis A TaxID=2690445 RepID=A0A8J7Z0B8_9CYAN|nr:PepSY domain-containing protein [Myxacorys almedinensis]NDJ17907.1 hypothetical protein [Myxacorys almedinensis A]